MLSIPPVLLPEGENDLLFVTSLTLQSCVCVRTSHPVAISNVSVVVTRYLMETTHREEFLFQLLASMALVHHAMEGLTEQRVNQSSFGVTSGARQLCHGMPRPRMGGDSWKLHLQRSLLELSISAPSNCCCLDSLVLGRGEGDGGWGGPCGS